MGDQEDKTGRNVENDDAGRSANTSEVVEKNVTPQSGPVSRPEASDELSASFDDSGLIDADEFDDATSTPLWAPTPSDSPAHEGLRVHKALIEAFRSSPTGIEMLGAASLATIIELPHDYRVLNISYPLEQELKLMTLLQGHDWLRPLSQTPLLLDQGSVRQTLQCLCHSLGAAEKFCEITAKSGLPDIEITITTPQALVLALDGTAGLLEPGKLEPFAAPTTDLAQKRQQNGGDDLVSPGISQDDEKWAESQNDQGEERKKLNKKMRLGPCSYLLVDLHSSSAIKNHSEKILAELEPFRQSADYHFLFDRDGNLTIVPFHERAIGRLAIWARGLRKLCGGTINLFIGKGEIISIGGNNIIMKDYPSAEVLNQFRQLGGIKTELFTTEEQLRGIKGTRDETLITINRKAKRQDLVAINVEDSVNFHTGTGPDKLIGFQDEYDDCRRILIPEAYAEDGFLEKRSRLVFLEGSAGTGKSRLIHEVTKQVGNCLKISIDPAGRNTPGFGLVDFADQIALFLKKNDPTPVGDMPPSVRKLMTFTGKRINDKLVEANRFAETIALYCSRALEYLEEQMGQLNLIFDDVHHIDRLSDPILMDIVGQITENETCKTVAFLVRRPEEQYHSTAQETLKHRIPNTKTIALQHSNGRSKLDFEDRDTVEDYVLHSLPLELRTNPENQHYRLLGSWIMDLGAIAKTPYAMDLILNEIKEKKDEYLFIQKDRIELSPEGRQKLASIGGGEMDVYYLERIREQLRDQKILQVLQAIALLGTKVATTEIICEFMEDAFDYNPSFTESCLTYLEQRGYLVAQDQILDIDDFSGDVYTTSYRLWHENLRDLLLNKTMDPEERGEMADRVFQATQNTDLISENQRFNILHFAAAVKELEDGPFWSHYTQCAQITLDESARQQLYGQGYEVAGLILNRLPVKDATPNALMRSVEAFANGEKLPDYLTAIITRALFSLVENAFFLGQLDTVFQAIETLESIGGHYYLNEETRKTMYLHGFNAAYVCMNKPKIVAYFKKLGEMSLKPNEQAVIFLKLAYAKKDFAACHKIVAELSEDQKADPEIARMVLRIEMEDLIEEIKKNGVDGDALYAGLDMTDAQAEKATDLHERVKELQSVCNERKEEVSNPKKLHPTDELHVMDMHAHLCSLHGLYDQAIQTYGEIWRLAMQMNVTWIASRAAMAKGDCEIFRALTRRLTRKNMLFYRQNLLSAIHTYGEDGIQVARKMEQQYWQFLLRVQRLRANLLLILTYDPRESMNFKTGVEKMLDMATEDAAFLDQKPWTDYIPEPNADGTKPDISAYETCYYITPLLVLYRQLCKDKEYARTAPLTAFESSEVIESCHAYAIDHVSDDNLKEKFRKTESLNLAIQSRFKKKGTN